MTKQNRSKTAPVQKEQNLVFLFELSLYGLQQFTRQAIYGVFGAQVDQLHLGNLGKFLHVCSK